MRAYNVFASDRLTRAMTHAWAQLSESPDHAELAPFIPSIVDATIADEDEFGSFYVMLFTGRPRRDILEVSPGWFCAPRIRTVSAARWLPSLPSTSWSDECRPVSILQPRHSTRATR